MFATNLKELIVTENTDIPKGKRELFKLMLWQAAAALLASVVNRWPIELYPGVDLFAGSIVTLLVSYHMGAWAGSFVGLCAGFQLSLYWHHTLPTDALIYALEGFYAGWMLRRLPRLRIVGTTISFWLLAGCWLTLLAHFFVLQKPYAVSLLFLLRTILNPMLCALAAELVLFCGIPLLQRVTGSRLPYRRLPLVEMISLILAVGVTSPVLVNSANYSRRYRADLLEKTAAADISRTKAALDAVTNVLNPSRRAVQAAAAIVEANLLRDPKDLAGMLSTTRQAYPELAGVCVVRPGGTIQISVPPFDGDRIPWDESIFSAADWQSNHIPRSQKNAPISDVYQVQGALGAPTVPIAEPVHGADGSIAGYVIAWFRLDTFHALCEKHLPGIQDASLTITDRRGMLIADSRQGWDNYRQARDFSREPEFRAASGAPSGRSPFSAVALDRPTLRSVTGVEMPFWLTWETIPETGWRVWLKRSADPVALEIAAIYTQCLLLLVGVILTAYPFGRWIASYLARPLKVLEASAEKLARGEMHHRPAIGAIYSCEVESLVSSFTRMAESLDTSWATQRDLIQQISAREREWENTFDTISDGIFIFDAAGRLCKTNRAAAEMLGGELLVHSLRMCCQLTPPTEQGGCLVHRALEKGQRMQAEVQDPSRRYPIMITVDPWRDVFGNIAGAVCTLRDVKELREAQEALRRQQALLSQLVESAHDPILHLDLEGRIVWGNNAAGLALGVARTDLVGRHYSRWILEEHRKSTAEFAAKTANGLPSVFEVGVLRSDGAQRQFVVTCNPILEGDRVTSSLLIARDVSEQQEALQRASMTEKMRALGQLASGVAHDFNNALAVILGRIQLLKLKLKEPVLLRHVSVLEQAGMDAAATVRRIQTFARQDQEDHFEILDLNARVQDAMELTRTRWLDDAQLRGIHYQVRFVPDKDVWVNGSASELREVFVNLIINALDAMKSGGRLRIWTHAQPDGAEVHFCDEGHGISESIKQRIFEPFFTTKGHAGSGLGLAVSYGIVLRHRGQILVDSRPGEGTTFTIQLPLVVPLPESSPEPETVYSAHYSVLLVDDEVSLRENVQEILMHHGHQVEVAATAEEAIDILQDRQFDLVLTDLSMPGIGGWGLAECIRKQWPTTKILLATGYAGCLELNPEQARLADGVVGKPFEFDALLEKLDATLSAAAAPLANAISNSRV